MIKMLIATAALLLCTAVAFAEPAAIGEKLSGQGFLCDTDAQVLDLYNAAKSDTSGWKLKLVYGELHALQNERHESACIYQRTDEVVTVAKREHLGVVTVAGSSYDAWLVGIRGNLDIPGSILFVEAAPSPAPKSDPESND